MIDKIEKLQQIIDKSRNIVFFGGRGVSTESGIPDFRSQDGIYNQKYKYPPEIIISHDFFMNRPKEFFEFYKEKMIATSAKPNPAHYKLAEMEAKGKLTAVITQNIDGLHQLAGSKKVYELHGSVHRNYCMNCGKFYDVDYVVNSNGIPKCDCGGIIKPDVVLYDENLDMNIFDLAIRDIENADTMIVAGTSLTVYPAANLIHYFDGDNLVLINRDETGIDNNANLVIHGNVGEVLNQIKVK